MKKMFFTQAVDDALAAAMARDARIIVFGEDVPLLRRNLLVRFGPKRVLGTPISESAFLGAGVAAAMAGTPAHTRHSQLRILPATRCGRHEPGFSAGHEDTRMAPLETPLGIGVVPAAS